ncbi:MAG: hypothetical protein IT267_02055 [Saprospiraceae bacterium]|nr:hypothetical protein [Saprospiraceae bacterium]
MNKLVLIVVLFLNAFCVYSQNRQENESKSRMIEKLESQRVAYITNKLELTSMESANFWPLYNEYSKKRKELRKEKSSQSIGNDSTLDEELEMEEKVLQLKKTYYEKFKSAIPVSKIAQLDEAEKQFRMEVLRTLRERRK